MSASQGLTRSRYMRLMAIGFIEVLCTVPIGTYIIVYNVQVGVVPYVSWAHTHNNYSQVAQIPSFIWRNEPTMNIGAEMYRWLLVSSALVFFALFGFADEARNHYRRVYTSLASRIGYSTFTLQGSSHGFVVHVTLSRLTRGSHLFFLQYFLSSLLEEQRRRLCLCGDRQAQIERLIRRPAYDPVSFRRQRHQARAVFAFKLDGVVFCGKF
jgi:hypothetical protein